MTSTKIEEQFIEESPHLRFLLVYASLEKTCFVCVINVAGVAIAKEILVAIPVVAVFIINTLLSEVVAAWI